MQVNLHTHPSRSWFNSSFVMDIRSSLKSCRDISLRFECATRNVICCSAVNLPLNAPATCSKESIFSHTTSIRSPCPPWWPALLAVAVATAAAAAAAADWPGLITELENSSCRQVHGLISRRTAQWRLVLAANPKSVYSSPDMVVRTSKYGHADPPSKRASRKVRARPHTGDPSPVRRDHAHPLWWPTTFYRSLSTRLTTLCIPHSHRVLLSYIYIYRYPSNTTQYYKIIFLTKSVCSHL